MNSYDFKVGMKVCLPNDDKVYTVCSSPKLVNDVDWLLGVKDNNGIVKTVKLYNVFPYMETEFTWDESVPTVGEPFKKCNGWYIKIDGKTPIIFDVPVKAKIYLIRAIKPLGL